MGILGAIAGALTTFFRPAFTLVQTIIKEAKPILQAVGHALIEIGKALGIIPETEEVDELGEKALQAEEKGDIKPENYDSVEKYIDAVETFDKYDPEAKHPDEQRFAKGTEIAGALAVEKCPEVDMAKIFSIALLPGFMTIPGRFEEICKLVVNNPTAANAIGAFFSGNAKDANTVNIAKDSLIAIEKQNNPVLTDIEAWKNIVGFKKD